MPYRFDLSDFYHLVVSCVDQGVHMLKMAVNVFYGFLRMRKGYTLE